LKKDLTCEIKVAKVGENYKECKNEIKRISRFGWLTCYEHASPADIDVWSKENLAEVRIRLSYRYNTIELEGLSSNTSEDLQ